MRSTYGYLTTSKWYNTKILRSKLHSCCLIAAVPSSQRLQFYPRLVHVSCVVEEVVLGGVPPCKYLDFACHYHTRVSFNYPQYWQLTESLNTTLLSLSLSLSRSEYKCTATQLQRSRKKFGLPEEELKLKDVSNKPLVFFSLYAMP